MNNITDKLILYIITNNMKIIRYHNFISPTKNIFLNKKNKIIQLS